MGAGSSTTSTPASALTVAVTGPTGEVGTPFMRALERAPEVRRVLAMARRPFDPGERGWSKTEYRRGISSTGPRSTNWFGTSMSSCTSPSSW